MVPGVEVVTVPFRVPSSLPPSRGVLRLHSQRGCHPFIEKRIEDEKCPKKCNSKCIEVPFQLAPSIRQILLITDQTSYRIGETGKMGTISFIANLREKDISEFANGLFRFQSLLFFERPRNLMNTDTRMSTVVI